MSHFTANIKDYRIFLPALFALSLLLMLSDTAWSVSAAPRDHTLTQPDGSMFKARQWGDEWSHGWETTTGYTIIRNRKTLTWVYGVLSDDGTIAPTTNIVGKESVRLNTPLHVRPLARRKTIDKIIKLPDTQERLPKPLRPQLVTSPTGTGNILHNALWFR